MVGADGGVFAFGDADFYGSMAGQRPSQPIVGIASTPDGKGYWVVGADGGVFAFGDADFYGSMAGQGLSQPIVGIASKSLTPTANDGRTCRSSSSRPPQCGSVSPAASTRF